MVKLGWNRLHPTVAATLVGVLAALALRAAGLHGLAARLDFETVLMRALLPFLLFSGALHIDPPGLKQEGGIVALLSTAGVVIATLFVGWSLRWALDTLGVDAGLPACLAFGALISPTDPVAVLAIFRRAQVPRSLSIIVGSESLLNDGMAVVTLVSILGATSGGGVSLSHAAWIFLIQTGGGLAAGLLLGELAARAVDGTKRLPVQFAATAVIAFAGYTAVNALGVSGLLAVTVAGMRVGNRSIALKARWIVADDALNMLAFGLLGLQAAVIPWAPRAALAGLAAVPLVLMGRAISVAACMGALRPWRTYTEGTFRALTWGGLRGAVPLALALSLPEGPEKPLLIVATYVVGLFSLVVQGSTL